MFRRFCIKGILTTRTSLHIGNGDTTEHPDLTVPKPDGTFEPVDIAAVAKDNHERAYLPGTSIKGNLRSWLTINKADAKLVESVFGSENQNAETLLGGKVEFCDAFYASGDNPSVAISYWRPNHLTGVATSVAIARHTRTAAKSDLLHEEFVPPGISFALELTGQEMNDSEIALLLIALDGFNDDDLPVTLGANTGDSYGKLDWKLTGLYGLTDDDVRQWLTQENPPVGYQGLLPLDDSDVNYLKSLTVTNSQNKGAALKILLDIQFESMFLVNDPSRVKKGETAAFLPLLNSQGQAILPAKSIRGAVRSQAEKILRTLNYNAACLEDSRCKSIYDKKDLDKLCLACRLFGASGWRSAIEFSDFTPIPKGEGVKFPQEFVGIDRFTGSVAGNAKFNGEPQYRPTLTGEIRVDLGKVEPWALWLLALTLRDLIEGDVSLGFGAGKGYAACWAKINNMEVLGTGYSPQIKGLLERQGTTKELLNGMSLTVIPDNVRLLLGNCLDDFQKTLSGYRLNSTSEEGK